MKQTIMTISFVFFIFAFGGCTKEDDCKEKGAGWIWDATKKECVITPKRGNDCKEKGAGWIWDATKKECIYPIPPSMGLNDKEKCEKKGVGYFWDENHPLFPNGTCYWNLFEECRNKNPEKPLLKNLGDHLNNREESRLGKIPLECVVRYITIINSTNRSIYVANKHFEYGWSRHLYSGACKSNYKEELDQVNYFRIVTSIIGDVRTSTEVIICEATVGTEEDSCPSSEGVYEVSAGRSGFVITKVDKTTEELNKMGCF